MVGSAGMTDKELTDYLAVATAANTGSKKVGIDYFTIEEVEPEEFVLKFFLTFRSGEFVFLTARRKVRQWPNLNTVAAYIKGLGFPDAPITLKLLRGGT